MALAADAAVLTAWSNDYGYDTVFARQVEAHGEAGGVLLALSTSGNSKNVILAAEAARRHCPVTLELGGKSPAVVCEDYPLGKAAERIPHGQPDCSTNRLYGVSDGLADTCTDSDSHDKSDGSTDRFLYGVADGIAGIGGHFVSTVGRIFRHFTRGIDGIRGRVPGFLHGIGGFISHFGRCFLDGLGSLLH